MDVCLAGRIAEEMMFGKDNVTTGASSDMQKATQIAKAMVLNYGMSEKVGFISVPGFDKESLGQETLEVINDEIHLLLDDSKKRVTQLLHNKKSDLDRLAKALMEHESLTEAGPKRFFRESDCSLRRRSKMTEWQPVHIVGPFGDQISSGRRACPARIVPPAWCLWCANLLRFYIGPTPRNYARVLARYLAACRRRTSRARRCNCTSWPTR